MKLALVGATGRVGSRILTEALARGHEITAIARHIEKLPSDPQPLTKMWNAVLGDEFRLEELISGRSTASAGYWRVNLTA
jgi:putative NADH-flavin reductase